MLIFAPFLENFAQRQNMPKFWKNLPNFQKLPNTCSPAIVSQIQVDVNSEKLGHSQLSILLRAVFDWFRCLTDFRLFLQNLSVNKLYFIVIDLIEVHLHKAKANAKLSFFFIYLCQGSV